MLLNDKTIAYLSFRGVNLFVQSSKSSKIKAFAFLTIEALFAVSIGLNLFYGPPGSPVMESVTFLLFVTQIICKQTVLLLRLNDFMEVFDYKIIFWPVDKFGKEFERQITAVHNTTRNFLKMIKYIIAVGSIGFLIKPFLDKDQMLPLSWLDVCSIRTSTICHIANYIIQCLYMLDLGWALYTFEELFFTLLMHGYCELEQIKNAFLSLRITEDGDESQVMLKVIIIIEHHSKVLEYLDEADKLLSIILLYQFSTSVFGGCLALLALIFEGFPPNLTTAFNNIPLVLGSFFQIFTCCVAGQYISDQSESIADVAYNLQWWVKHQPQFKRALSLVIQRAYRRKQITAGGVWNLDLITFLAVAKGAMSLITFVQTLDML